MRKSCLLKETNENKNKDDGPLPTVDTFRRSTSSRGTLRLECHRCSLTGTVATFRPTAAGLQTLTIRTWTECGTQCRAEHNSDSNLDGHPFKICPESVGRRIRTITFGSWRSFFVVVSTWEHKNATLRTECCLLQLLGVCPCPPSLTVFSSLSLHLFVNPARTALARLKQCADKTKAGLHFSAAGRYGHQTASERSSRRDAQQD